MARAWAGRGSAAAAEAARRGGRRHRRIRSGRGGGGGGGGGGRSDERLLQLAEGQRMNTALRRKIFVAIMGADDYMDAHGRVSRLKVAKGQQAEIVRVLLDCCGQEGVFNR